MITIHKSGVWAAALTLSTMSLSSVALAAKTYNVILDRAAQAGAIQLEPGQYAVKLDGSNAVFTDTQTRREFTVPVKVENSDKKFDATAISSIKQGASEKIMEIDLGGSKTKLEFGQ